VIYFQNIFVVSLIDSVVITKCYNSYLGYLTKISHLVQAFFLYMLCCLLIEGIEFLLRDSLLHAPFFVLQIKNVQENDHLQYFFLVRYRHLLSLTRLTCCIWTKNYKIYFQWYKLEAVFSSNAKKFCDGILLIWSTK